MANESPADRNLLFGILALQMDLITNRQLLTAINAWLHDKTQPLSKILVEQKALTADDCALLEPLVERHIAKHAGDVAQSLASLGSASSVCEFLKQQIEDPDVQASLMHVGMGTTDDRGVVDHGTIDFPSASAGTRFRFLRPLAKGGLGVLCVAFDEELHREVALKEIQTRHANQVEKRARFLAEAEITGGLEHPGIVPVYGLGAYPDGRPYYAMRYVRGHSLSEAIKRFHAQRVTMSPADRNVAFRNLIGRIVDVCQAIQYAHHRGVLHRDLKPGNIMLGKYGETLVVDWGLAKVGVKHEATVQHHPDSIEPTQSLHLSGSTGQTPTIEGAAMGTPDFMSPEQAGGKLNELGPATDIYSLGATLYVLLTGRAAFRCADASKLPEVISLIQQGDFPKPRAVDASVPPALDAICLKAMAKRPTDRYASAQSLADDLENWLADEPVSSYLEPWTQRMHRWLRRHKTFVSGVAVLLLTSVIGLTIGLVAVKAEQQRTEEKRQEAVAAKELAEERRQQAEAAKAVARKVLVQSVSNDALVMLAAQDHIYPQQKAYLASIGSYYEQAAPDGTTDAELESSCADFFTKAVRLLHTMKAFDEAAQLARKAVSIYTTLATSHPDQLKYQHSLGRSHQNLGTVLSGHRQFQAAEFELREALSINGRLSAPANNDLQLTMERTRIITQLSLVLRELKRPADAEAIVKPQIEIQSRLISNNPDNVRLQLDLGNLLSNLGQAQQDSAQLGPAAETYRKAIKLFQDLSDKHPNSQSFALQAVFNLGNLGRLLTDTDPDNAVAAFRQALALAHQRANFPKDYDAFTEYCERLCQVLCKLKKVDQAAGLLDTCDKFRDVKGIWSYTAASIFCRCAAADPAKAKQYTDDAIKRLQLAIEHGFDDAAELEKDEVLKPLRERPEFAALVEKAKAGKK